MKGQTVYVITNTESGWDNIMGIYLSEQGAIDYLKDSGYTEEAIENEEIAPFVLHEERLEE